jgi:hypothetical protein
MEQQGRRRGTFKVPMFSSLSLNKYDPNENEKGINNDERLRE